MTNFIKKMKEVLIERPRRRRDIAKQAREGLMADKELRDTLRSLKGQAEALKIINPHHPALKALEKQLKDHFAVLRGYGISPRKFLKP